MASTASQSEPTPTPTVDESALIARLQAGEDAAFAELVEANIGRMLAVAKRMLGNEEDANDAVQDAFMSAFKAIDRFEGNAQLAPGSTASRSTPRS